MTAPTVDVHRLQALASRHDVCYEIWPEYLPTEGRKLKVGVEIDLCGAVDMDHPHYCAGCPKCERTYSDLHEIAEWVQPERTGEVSSEILAFDHALHMGHGERSRPEIVVIVHLANGHAGLAIEDRDQAKILKSVSERLASIGVERR
ncbi:MAG: hypothetical protein HY820_17630 [Acidobacteria bacterium]|nr:hypothetical protein [Acidobacteriota bacterium]